MANINIYGTLYNNTTDGTIAYAAQVLDQEYENASGGTGEFQSVINKEHADSIDVLKENINTLSGQVGDNNDTLEQDITEIRQDITEINQSISDANGRIDDLEEKHDTEVSTINNNINTLSAATQSLPNTIVTSVGGTTSGASQVTVNVQRVTKSGLNYGGAAAANFVISAATQSMAGVMTASDKQALDNAVSAITDIRQDISSIEVDITEIQNGTSIQHATATAYGTVKLGSDTTLSADSRTYPVQNNASGQMMVRVPWTDNNTDVNVRSTMLDDDETHYLIVTTGKTTNYTGEVKGAAQITTARRNGNTILINTISGTTGEPDNLSDSYSTRVVERGFRLSMNEVTDIGGLSMGGGSTQPYVVLYSGDDGIEPIYVAQYNSSTPGWSKQITLMDNGGNQIFNDVTANKISVSGGSSSEVLLANGETTTLATINGNSLLDGGNITISAGTNDDHTVIQNAASSISGNNGSYNVLLGATMNNSAAETSSVNKASDFTYNPSTHALRISRVGGTASDTLTLSPIDGISLTASPQQRTNLVSISKSAIRFIQGSESDTFRADVNGVTAKAFIKTDGTSTQLLAADGSVQIPLTDEEINAICV